MRIPASWQILNCFLVSLLLLPPELSASDMPKSEDRMENYVPSSLESPYQSNHEFFIEEPSLSNFKAKLQPEMLLLQTDHELNFYSSRGDTLYTLPKKILGLLIIKEAVVCPRGKGVYISGTSSDSSGAEKPQDKLIFISDNYIKNISPPGKTFTRLYMSSDETLYLVSVESSNQKSVLLYRKNNQWFSQKTSIDMVIGYTLDPEKSIYLWGWAYDSFNLKSIKHRGELVQDNICQPIPKNLLPLSLPAIDGIHLVKIYETHVCENASVITPLTGDSSAIKYDITRRKFTRNSVINTEKYLYIKKGDKNWSEMQMDIIPSRLTRFSDGNVAINGETRIGKKKTLVFLTKDGRMKVHNAEEFLKGRKLIKSSINFACYLEELSKNIFPDQSLNLDSFSFALTTLSKWSEPVNSDYLYKVFLKGTLGWMENPVFTKIHDSRIKTALSILMGKYQKTWLAPYLSALYFDISLDSSMAYLAPRWISPLNREKLFHEAIAHNISSQDPQWPQNRIDFTLYSFELLNSIQLSNPEFLYKYGFKNHLNALERALIQLEVLKS